MIDLVLSLMSGLVAGLGGSLVGGAVVWWALRGRMNALAAALRVPRTDPPSLTALRDELHRLARQQAAQDALQIERFHQWQRDLMCFLGDSQERQIDDFRALLQRETPGALTASPAFAAAPSTRELTDEEIDALPPELPKPTRRKRLLQPPATPPMRNV